MLPKPAAFSVGGAVTDSRSTVEELPLMAAEEYPDEFKALDPRDGGMRELGTWTKDYRNCRTIIHSRNPLFTDISKQATR